MGAFKLGKMTFGSLFKKPETVMYPIEKKPQPAGLKGHIVIDVDRCILCGMCDRSCSTDCITVDKQNRFWEIQPYQCVQCGYCITVCPKDCLSMDPDYWMASTEASAVRYEVPEQVKEQKAEKKDAGKEEVPAKTAAQKAEPEVEDLKSRDEQLESLIGLMDPEKAEKVKSALS